MLMSVVDGCLEEIWERSAFGEEENTPPNMKETKAAKPKEEKETGREKGEWLSKIARN